MRIRRFLVPLALAVTAGTVLTAALPALAATNWVAVGSDRADPVTESQGLTSVEVPPGRPNRYTSVATIPLSVRAQGWNHVGDPDARDGYYIEPYQRDSGSAKMFRVQAPDGSWAQYTHALFPGEALNNSFDAISADGQWLVSGEWGTMTRLLVFPAPGRNPAAVPSRDLALAGTINLDRPVRDVQGCDFASATRLLCSSDDPDGSLFGIAKPLLQVDLAAPLSGAPVSASVTALRQIPLQSACSGTFEVEGIDYDGRDATLRILVMSPGACLFVDSRTWRFTQG
jgi:hypothetical protein